MAQAATTAASVAPELLRSPGWSDAVGETLRAPVRAPMTGRSLRLPLSRPWRADAQRNLRQDKTRIATPRAKLLRKGCSRPLPKCRRKPILGSSIKSGYAQLGEGRLHAPGDS